MPVLSLNFGVASVKGVYADAKGNLSDYTVPYSYSKNLYAHFYSEEDFYADIAGHIMKQLKVPKTDLQIVATGFPMVPPIGVPYASTALVNELASEFEGYETVCLGDCTVITNETFASFYTLDNSQLGKAERDYLLNIATYRSIQPTSLSEYNLMFSNIWNMLRTSGETKLSDPASGKELLFHGELFDDMTPEKQKLAFLYIISLVVEPGIKVINVDMGNLLPHIVHIHKQEPSLVKMPESLQILRLGTLVNSPGNTAVLLETDLGTSQLLEIEAGKMVFVPLDMETNARMVLKNHNHGDVEHTVTGGELGLIIDTRNKNDLSGYDYSQLQMDIDNNLKNVGEVMGHL